MYQNIVIPAVTKQLGKKQTIIQPAYSIGVSTGLARGEDGKMLVDVTHMEADRLAKADGCRLMRVNEWRALASTSLGLDAMAFDDILGRNNESRAVYEWLNEVLKRPRGRKYVKNENGREFNLYTVFVDGEPAEDLWLPSEGIVRAWYDCGLPAETTGSHDHETGSEIHYFQDYRHAQIALRAGRCWRGTHDKCFSLIAYTALSRSGDDLGFRKVREFSPKKS